MWSSTLKIFFSAIICSAPLSLISEESPNQTASISAIHSGKHLPFKIAIERANFQLPAGFHSGVFATYQGKWLFLAGRTNGMHGFENNDNNFPPQKQNTWVYVVDPCLKTVRKRSLHSIHSGLNKQQIDGLSVTSPQFYQEGHVLYMTGGYGVDTLTGEFSTKPLLTAIDIPGLMHWVTQPANPYSRKTAAQFIRQIEHPIFQVTGGYMTKVGHHATLLIFGQNFQGAYHDRSNGDYTQEVRRFRILDNGQDLAVEVLDAKPNEPNPNYRRRDLNVVPATELVNGELKSYLIALSGVFTLSDGAWTVPVSITGSGHATMEDPSAKRTFKQGMNNYICAAASLFSQKEGDFYSLLMGGISYGYFDNGRFITDSELPFINQVTAVRRNRQGHFSQFLLDSEYPTILSKGPHRGNPLLFGAGAQFIPADGIPQYDNGVIKLDKIKESTLLGYIVGGIQSTVPNITSKQDSSASPYIFEVFLQPNCP